MMGGRLKFILGGVVTIIAFGAITPVLFSQTLSVTELQTRLADLFSQLSALQAQVNSASGATPAPESPTNCNFTRDLFSGVRSGEDVRCLQKYLNSRGFSLTSSGIGSPGNETNNFGDLTRRAVIRWQTAYGISPASGYFGPLSRKKYVEVTGGVVSAPAGTIRIDSVTPSSGSVGTRVVVRGSGFASVGNSLNFAGAKNVVTDILSLNNTIVFDIPENLCGGTPVCAAGDVTEGVKLLSVSNASGTSNELEFRVTKAPVEIFEITPSDGLPGTVVTIRGSGFTPTGNIVYIGDALIIHPTIYNVSSSDGATLTFTYNPPTPDPLDFEEIETMDEFLGVLEKEGMTFEQFRSMYVDDYQIVVQNGNSARSTNEIFFRGGGALPF